MINTCAETGCCGIKHAFLVNIFPPCMHAQLSTAKMWSETKESRNDGLFSGPLFPLSVANCDVCRAQSNAASCCSPAPMLHSASLVSPERKTWSVCFQPGTDGKRLKSHCARCSLRPLAGFIKETEQTFTGARGPAGPRKKKCAAQSGFRGKRLQSTDCFATPDKV